MSLSHDVLGMIFEAFMESINKDDLKIAYEIHDGSKQLLYYSHPNLSKDKQNWIRRKRNVVLTFSQSSLDIAVKNNHDMERFIYKYGYSHQDFALVGGGVPIVDDNQSLIGVLTVTGLKPQEDHDLALDILKKIKNK